MKIVGISVKNILIDNIQALYESAFPADERRNFDDFCKILECDERFFVYALLEDGAFVGFVTVWKWDDFSYIEHFAISSELRNSGRGSVCLDLIIKEIGEPVILEVEPPVDDLSKRRVGFYERNGFFVWNDIKYIQPPYDASKSSIELKLMSRGEICFSGDDDEKIQRMKAAVYGKK